MEDDVYESYRRAAVGTAYGALDEDPKKAAESFRLSRETGTSPAAIYHNYDDYTKNYRAQLSSQIIRGNPAIMEYIHKHPMGAAVSNDDWHNLDIATRASGKIKTFKDLMSVMPTATTPSALALSMIHHMPIIGDAIQKAEENFKEELSVISPYQGYTPRQDRDRSFFSRLRAAEESGSYALLNTAVQAPLAGMAGAMAGMAGFAGELYTQLGGNAAWGARLARDVHMGIDSVMANMMAHGPWFEGWRRFQEAPGMPQYRQLYEDTARQIKDHARRIHPYLAAGEDIPANIDRNSDAFKAVMAEVHARNLDAAMEDVSATETSKRSPALYAELERAQHSNKEIGISLDGIRELYAGKEPGPEDGLLGKWIPDIADRIREAESTGGDVTVPLKDYLPNGKDTHKALREHLRIDEAGLTLREVKERGERVKPPAEEAMAQEGPLPIDQVRAEAGLKPLDETLAQHGPREVPITAREEGQLFNDEARQFLIDKGEDTSRIPPDMVIERARDLGWAPEEGPLLRHGDVLSHMPKKLLDVDKDLADSVLDVIDTTTGGHATALPAKTILYQGRPVEGIYMMLNDRIPFIQWAMDTLDPIGTGRHEVIHFLKRNGFFLDAEWKTLENTAIKEAWIHKKWPDMGSVYERYAHLKGMTTELMLEESIAEEFARWQRSPREYPKELGTVFEKLASYLRGLRAKFDAMSTKDPRAQALFEMVLSGEIGKRGPADWARNRVFKETLAQHGPADELFERAKTLGMTTDRYMRHVKAINKIASDDQKAQLEASIRSEKYKQTTEWKAHEAEMRGEVERSVLLRPDVSAGLLFKLGEFNGDKVKKPLIDPRYLTPEQKAAIPKEYLSSSKGFHPAQIAMTFHDAFKSGDDLINQLISFEKDRGKAPHKQYVKNLIDDETAMKMADKYGDLEGNILDAARDHVVSTDAIDLLHEEMYGLGLRTGLELPVSRAQLEMAVRYEFLDSNAYRQDPKRLLADANRASERSADALLKEDVAESFRQKQNQAIATIKAKSALELKKLRIDLGKLAQRYQKEPTNADKGTTNHIQQLLKNVGIYVNKTEEQMAADFKQAPGGDSLPHFIAHLEQNGITPDIKADWLLDGEKKHAYDLTVGEFRELHKAIKALDKIGRDMDKFQREGVKQDRRELIDKYLIPILQTLGAVKVEPGYKPGDTTKLVKAFKNMSILQESIFNRFDRDDPNGPFNNTFSRPAAEASGNYTRLFRKTQQEIWSITKGMKTSDLKTPVENPLFYHFDGTPMKMTQGDVLAVLQIIGNPENLEKLARGYKIQNPQHIIDWVMRYTTKEDWDRAQGIGNIFKRLFDISDREHYRRTNTHLDRIEIREIKNKYGTYEGWFHPLKADENRPGEAVRAPYTSDALIGQDYHFVGKTNQSYTKKRQNVIYPVELSFDIISARLTQMIHDISFRDFVTNTNAVFRDEKFHQALVNHYGKDTADQGQAWLHRIANRSNLLSPQASTANAVGEKLLSNGIMAYVGLNPNTWKKHTLGAFTYSIRQAGPKDFIRHMGNMFKTDEATGKAYWRLPDEQSEEVGRRMKFIADTMHNDVPISMVRSGPREASAALGSWPLGFFDMVTSKITFNAVRERALEAGHDVATANYMGDRQVRFSHGSTAMTNRAEIASGNFMAKTMTSFYNVYSDILQRQFDICWKSKDLIRAMKGDLELEPEKRRQFAKDIALNTFAYVISTALIHEIVTPMISDKDPLIVTGLKLMSDAFATPWVGGRELMSIGTSIGRGPGMLSGASKDFHNFAQSIHKVYNKGLGDVEADANMVKNILIMFAWMKGIGYVQSAKEAEFLIKFAAGRATAEDGVRLLLGLEDKSKGKHR